MTQILSVTFATTQLVVKTMTYIVVRILDDQQHGTLDVLHESVDRLKTKAVFLRAVDESPWIPDGTRRQVCIDLEQSQVTVTKWLPSEG